MSFISETEIAFQQVTEALARFEKPPMTPEICKALWMTIGNAEALTRLCERVKEKSNGRVQMRPISFEERGQFFSIEVLGFASYFVLQSDNKIQPIIIMSNNIIFDKK
jgi:hypothetical protein